MEAIANFYRPPLSLSLYPFASISVSEMNRLISIDNVKKLRNASTQTLEVSICIHRCSFTQQKNMFDCDLRAEIFKAKSR